MHKPSNYDPYYRSQCQNPIHYDRMILLLLQNNPSCKNAEWACDAINNCIRVAMNHGDSAIGMCMALKTRDKIRLFLEPLSNRFDGILDPETF